MVSAWVNEADIHFTDSLTLLLLQSSAPLCDPMWILPRTTQTLPHPGPATIMQTHAFYGCQGIYTFILAHE